MSSIEEKKSYAFITAYLLGAERRVLEKEYPEDYAYSEGLEKFKGVKNAELLRVLSKVKQSILRNYYVYKDATDFTSSSKGFLDEDKALLRNHNIDLDNEFKLHLDITAVVNLITKHINRNVLGVLAEFKTPHINQVASLFNFPTVDKKSLAKMLNLVKGNWTKYPHCIYINKGSKTNAPLNMLLNTDRILFIGGHNIVGEKYEIIEEVDYDWSHIKVDKIIPKLPITLGSLIYVDCDNIDYFKFLSVIEALKLSSLKNEKHEIKLFMDEMTSPLWALTDKIAEGCFTFEKIKVSRIKDEKSVVDMVMATHITRDSMVQGHKQQGIMSSDSDFYGLMESGIKLFVLYDSKHVRNTYMGYLRRKKYINFDISSLDSSQTRFDFKQNILLHLCLTHLSSLPIANWNVNDISNYVLESFNNDITYGMSLTLTETEDLVMRVLKDLKMETVGTKIAISSLGSEVEVELDVA